MSNDPRNGERRKSVDAETIRDLRPADAGEQATGVRGGKVAQQDFSFVMKVNKSSP